MSLAVVVIASEKRRDLVPRILGGIRDQEPDELLIVADFPVEAKGVRSLVVEPMLRNTVDALVKRDVGWAATESKAVCFLCDDHMLDPEFIATYREKYHNRGWGILAPQRYTDRHGERCWLNIGQRESYVGGHCVIMTRETGRLLPWSATHHHPNWDVIHTHRLLYLGAKLCYADRDLAVEDIEPGAEPWR